MNAYDFSFVRRRNGWHDVYRNRFVPESRVGCVLKTKNKPFSKKWVFFPLKSFFAETGGCRGFAFGPSRRVAFDAFLTCKNEMKFKKYLAGVRGAASAAPSEEVQS